MVDSVNNVRSFVNYAIFCELCDRMRFEVDCVKSHHRVISEGLSRGSSAVIDGNLDFTQNKLDVHKVICVQ